MKRVGEYNNWSRSREAGAVNPLLIATILLALLLVATAGGFVWAYTQMLDWKNNVNAKVDAAVSVKVEEQKKTDQAQAKEEEKKPNRIYQGPSDMGSIRFNYPKTWSAYTADSSNDTLQVYFNPLIVPKVDPDNTPYALRVDVTSRSYADTIQSYSSLVQKGLAKATPVVIGKTDKFTGYEGMRVDGQLSNTINGSAVIFKLRDKTMILHVDSQDYINDFNNTILASLKFEP